MVNAIINYCNLQPNSVILDPFCGSGTTLVESILLSFTIVGIDINPIACLSSIIKTNLLGIPLEHLTQDNKKYFNMNYYKINYNSKLHDNIAKSTSQSSEPDRNKVSL